MKQNNLWFYWVTLLLQAAVFGIGLYMMSSYPVGTPPFISGLAFIIIATLMFTHRLAHRD